MRYILLIYTDPASYANLSEADQGAIFQEYYQVTDEMRGAGVYLGGEPLQGLEAATTVRVKQGKRMITDGPFAETKEYLAGYYLLNCKDLDEALEWAGRIPDARYGSVEVRPIAEIPEQAGQA
jgi:hypothetical protein